MLKNKVISFVFIVLTSLLLGRIAIFYFVAKPTMHESIWYNILNIFIEIMLNMKFAFDITVALHYKMLEEKHSYKKLLYDDLGKVTDGIYYGVSALYMGLYFIKIYSNDMDLGNVLIGLNTSILLWGLMSNRMYSNEEEIFIVHKNLTISYIEMLSIRRVNSQLVNIITVKGNYEIVCNNKCMELIKGRIDMYGVLNQKEIQEHKELTTSTLMNKES